jgi:hypothetical protein
VTIALAIPHCSWDPDRVRTLRRLIEQLRSDEPVGLDVRVFAEDGPAHCSVWSDKMWTWGEEIGADEFITIQDDAVVAPNFWPAMLAMMSAAPREIIGLQAIHPIGPALARNGCNWYTTRDMLAGVAYRIPGPALQVFNHWRHTMLRDGTQRRINEDNIVALFVASTGGRIWHPLPTIVDHHPPGEPIKSNYGHDSHANQNGTWTWREAEVPTDPAAWMPRNPIPAVNADGSPVADPPPVVHLGRFYQHTPWHLARNVVGWSEDTMRELESDVVRFAQR